MSVTSGYEPAVGDLHRRGSVPSSPAPGSQHHMQQVPTVKGVQPFLGQQPRLSHGELTDILLVCMFGTTELNKIDWKLTFYSHCGYTDTIYNMSYQWQS